MGICRQKLGPDEYLGAEGGGGIKNKPLSLYFTGALGVTKGIITVNIWEHVINK